MITLQQALTKNQNLLGANFETLGKKAYLSYNKGNGWSVQKFDGCFGFIKQIFRWLGFYSSTHLKNVAEQIQKEANVAPALKTKINDCWKRQSGKDLNQAAPKADVPRAAVPRAAVPRAAVPRAAVPRAAVPRAAVPRVAVPPAQALRQLGTHIGGTYISVEAGNITQNHGVTAIVNAANEVCLGGGGVDGAIHQAAGPELVEECRKLPIVRGNIRCETGNAVITKSGLLAQHGIQRVIHAVGPRYNVADPAGSTALLRATYISSLNVAHANGIRSIAFPAISTGIFGYPFEDATRLAMQTIEEYAAQHPGRFDEIKLLFIRNIYDKAVAVWKSYPHPGIPENV